MATATTYLMRRVLKLPSCTSMDVSPRWARPNLQRKENNYHTGCRAQHRLSCTCLIYRLWPHQKVRTASVMVPSRMSTNMQFHIMNLQHRSKHIKFYIPRHHSHVCPAASGIQNTRRSKVNCRTHCLRSLFFLRSTEAVTGGKPSQQNNGTPACIWLLL